MTKDHSPQMKDDRKSEALRSGGMNPQATTRSASSDSRQTATQSGGAKRYEQWTKERLYGKAREVGIEGRSRMSREELIDALRNGS